MLRSTYYAGKRKARPITVEIEMPCYSETFASQIAGVSVTVQGEEPMRAVGRGENQVQAIGTAVKVTYVLLDRLRRRFRGHLFLENGSPYFPSDWTEEQMWASTTPHVGMDSPIELRAIERVGRKAAKLARAEIDKRSKEDRYKAESNNIDLVAIKVER